MQCKTAWLSPGRFLIPSGRVHLGVVGSIAVDAADREKLGLAKGHDANDPIMVPGRCGYGTPLVGARIVDVSVRAGYDVQPALQGGSDGPAGSGYRSPGRPGVGRRIVDIEIGHRLRAVEASNHVELAADDAACAQPVVVRRKAPNCPLVRGG